MEPLDLAIGLRAVRPRVLRMIVWASQVSRRRCERYLPPLSDMTGAMVTPRSANHTTARCRMAGGDCGLVVDLGVRDAGVAVEDERRAGRSAAELN